MKTSEFHFDLPPEQIAQQPEQVRSRSRLLVVDRQSETLDHRTFHDLPTLLDCGDLLVMNDTRVIPARTFAHKARTGGKVEFLFLEEIEPTLWDVLMRCSRRPQIGDHMVLEEGVLTVELLSTGEQGRARVRVHGEKPLLSHLAEQGATPLPPYIHQDPARQQADRDRYQTIYATKPGAVAAPTAGLHFDERVFEQLERTGVRTTHLTLHVGLGTFRPVTCDTLEDHPMEAERYTLPEEAATAIQMARANGGRVVAVGSTSVRTLETAASCDGSIMAGEGRTNLFIYPPYGFRVVDAMVTNFHLPQSTLLMMVSAFAGIELMRHAYDVAVKEGYRFFSYGDSMLIL